MRGEILRNWSPGSTGFDIEVKLDNLVERRGYTSNGGSVDALQADWEKGNWSWSTGFTIFKRILVGSL